MSETPKLYIAGMGMITPVGGNVAMTVAAVEAGISGYKNSEYRTNKNEPVVMAKVPNLVFEQIQCNVGGSDVFNYRQERIIRLAIIALRESVSKHIVVEAVPLLLAMPENNLNDEECSPIIPALTENIAPWINTTITRRFSTGRAAGMEALDFAFNYLMNQPQDYLLVAGVDSFEDDSVITKYQSRILSIGAADAFAPGEGASALLLTRHIELAEKRDGYAIALNRPAIAKEDGNLFSEKPYKGEGLDKTFKLALHHQPSKSIHAIYSSMNGENHWAKEYGVAYLRSKNKFIDDIKIEHPADCYGDLGAATSTALIILAAEKLYKANLAKKHLVYSSSDKETRGALVIEKILA